MEIITRGQWGARYGDGNGAAQTPASEVWLHHSVTIAPDLVPPWSDDYAAIRTIESIGRNRFGSVYGFPYTFAVTPAGLIFEGHDVRQMGAHTGGHNWQGRGICLVGNYEDNEPTDEMLRAVAWLLQHGQRQGWWEHARLTGGHRDTKATACPGIKAYRRIDDINRLAAGGPIDEEDDVGHVDSISPKAAREIAFHLLNFFVEGERNAPRRVLRRVLQLTRGGVVRSEGKLNALLAQQAEPTAIAAALRPGLTEDLLPLLLEAVEDVLGTDNEAVADQIVDKLADRLAGVEEGTP